MNDDYERIVYDRKVGMALLQKRHSHIHGSLEHIEALAAFLIRAAYEIRKGMHDAPPLPRATWLPPEDEDSVRVTPLVETVAV